MGDLDGGGIRLGVAVGREEPVGGERVEEAVGLAAIGKRFELGPRHPPPGVHGSLAKGHHP